jgi:uncharacterized Zn finger protein
MYYQWAPYVSVAERRKNAAAEMAKLAKKGHQVLPVVIQGRTIVTTAWGKAWCDNLEQYSDYENRLPRGRTYVRNGSVVDLHINAGKIEARVSGSSLYTVSITIKAMTLDKWQQVCADCAGEINSLVELLKGKFSAGVMQRLCRQGDGLFPTPKEIKCSCSCPDGAYLCKHVAAVMYGVGARFDHKPELLFTLRQVDSAELLSRAGTSAVATQSASERALVGDDVSALFGVEMDSGKAPELPTPAEKPIKTALSAKKTKRDQTTKKSKSKPTATTNKAIALPGTNERSKKLTSVKATAARVSKKPGRPRRSVPMVKKSKRKGIP